MQAIEFSTKINKDNTIEVPVHYAKLLRQHKQLKVLVLFEEEKESETWDEAAVNGSEIKHLISESAAFDFLNAEGEDIYTDEDLKVKY